MKKKINKIVAWFLIVVLGINTIGSSITGKYYVSATTGSQSESYSGEQSEDIVLSEDMIVEGDYILSSGVLDLNGYKMQVEGDFIHQGGDVIVNGGELLVEGEYNQQYAYTVNNANTGSTVPNAGRLFMNNDADVVHITGDFIPVSYGNSLTKGTLELEGSIKKIDLNSVFMSVDKNTIVFCGNQKQYIEVLSRVNNLIINQGTEGEVVIDKGLIVQNDYQQYTHNIDGRVTLWSVPNVDELYGEISIAKDCRLKNDIIFHDNVLFSGQLALDNCEMIVDGKFYQPSKISMSGSNAKIIVKDDFVVKSGTIESGNIELIGNMQPVSKDSYIVTKDAAKLYFVGNQKQLINISDTRTSIANITIDNPLDVEAQYDINIVNVDCVSGKLLYSSGNVRGITLQDDVVYEGDCIIGSGTMKLNGHKMHVKGDLIVKNGSVVMSNPDDYLLVEGNYISQTKTDTSMTNGIFELKGDFTEAVGSGKFVSTNQHKVLLSGDEKQNIKLLNNASYFTNVDFCNKSGITVNNLPIKGHIKQEGLVSGTILIGSETNFEGNAYSGDVILNERYSMTSDLMVNGSLDVKGELLLNGYHLSVLNNLSINKRITFDKGRINCGTMDVRSIAFLVMNNEEDSLAVVGNASFSKNDSSAYASSMSKGSLIVGGNLILPDFKNGNVKLSKDYKIILNGTEKQEIIARDTYNVGMLIIRNTSEEGIVVKEMLSVDEIVNETGASIVFADGGIFGYTLQDDEIVDGDLLISGGRMDLNGHTLQVNGDFVLSNAELCVNGGSLRVTKDCYFAKRVEDKGKQMPSSSNGTITMGNEDDEMVIEGNLFIDYGANSIEILKGKILLGGNFDCNSIITFGQDVIIDFDGRQQQQINCNNKKIFFSNVYISNRKGVWIQDEATTIYGEFLSHGYPIEGKVCLNSATKVLDNVLNMSVIFSKTVIPHDIHILKDAELQNVDLNGHHITIDGDCLLSYDGKKVCTDGVLEIKGNLLYNAREYKVIMKNKVIMSGSTKQIIQDNKMNWHFSELEIANTSEEGVYSEGLLDLDVLIDPENKLSFFCKGEAGYVLQEDTMLTGDFTQIMGEMDLNGYTLTVTGNYLQRNGSLKINGGNLIVYGDYILGNPNSQGEYRENHAYLQLDGEKDKVHVKGNAIFASGYTYEDYWKCGTIDCSGDLTFIQIISDNTIIPNQINLIFSGNQKQIVTYTGKNGSDELLISNIVNENISQEGVVFSSDVSIVGSINGDGRINNLSGTTLTWASEHAISVSDLDGNLEINQIATKLQNNMNVRGKLLVKAPLDLNGHRMVADIVELSDELILNAGVLQVDTKYTNQSTKANLISSNELDVVQIKGEMNATKGTLTLSAGKLDVKGNMTISGAKVVTDGEHSTILSSRGVAGGGPYIQKITITNAKLDTLVLKKSREYYIFNQDVENMCNSLVDDVQDITPPTKPTGLLVSNVTCTEVTLNWDASTDDEGDVWYDVYRDDKKVMSVSNTEFTERRLNPNTTYNYYIVAKDSNSNYSEKSAVLEVTTSEDSIAPSIPQNVQLCERFGEALMLTWDAATDNINVAGYRIYRDGELIKDIQGTEYLDAGLEINKHYKYQLSSYDESGNESDLSKNYDFYTQAATIDSINLDNYESLSGESKSISMTLVNAGSSKGYQVNMSYVEKGTDKYVTFYNALCGRNTSYKSKITANAKLNLTRIKEEEIEIVIKITDATGYSYDTHYTCYLDHTPPSKIKEFDGEARNGVVVLSYAKGAELDVAGYHLYRMNNQGSFELLTNIQGREKTFYYDKAVDESEEYSYCICAYDEEGQESEKSDVVTVVCNHDDEEPRINSVTPFDGLYNNSVDITIKATDNKELDKLVIESFDREKDEYQLLIEKKFESDTIVYTLDTTKYSDELNLRFTVYDMAGNENGDEFTCVYQIDNCGPSVPTGLKANASSTSVLLTWDRPGDDDYKEAVVEQVFEDGTTKEIRKVEADLGCMIENLQPLQHYSYQVTFFDQLENKGKTSEKIQVSTTEDEISPIISEIRFDSQKSFRPDISFEGQNKPFTSKYGYFNGEISLCVVAKDNCAVGEVVVEYSYDQTDWVEIYRNKKEVYYNTITEKIRLDTKDMQEGKVFFRAYAKDASGNEGDKNQYIAECIIDKTATAAVDKLTATSESGSVFLKWNEPIDNDVYAFALYRSEEGMDSYRCIDTNIKKTSYYDITAEANINYCYKLIALDFAGNKSKFSNVAVGQRALDETKPVIHSVYPSDNTCISKNVQLRAAVSDNVKVANVEFYIVKKEEGSVKTKVATVNVGKKEGIATCKLDTTQYDNGDYEIIVLAKDDSGNVCDNFLSECEIRNITLPTPKMYVTEGDWCVDIGYTADNPELSYVLYRKNEQKEKEFTAIQTGKGNLMYRDNDVKPYYSYVYKLFVQDKAGNGSYSVLYYAKPRAVDEQNPMADIQVNTSIIEGYEFVLNGMNSTDNDCIAKYEWDFGDGSKKATEPYPRHTYSKTGKYTVTLTVTDPSGNSDTKSVIVNVLAKATTGTAIVEVRNEQGSPLRNAMVYVNSSTDSNDIAYTDNNGQAMIMQKAGTYQIALYAPGYIAVEKQIDIQKYGERVYVYNLEKGDTVNADFTVRQMNFEEMLEAGIDIADPQNHHVVIVETRLDFVDDIRTPESGGGIFALNKPSASVLESIKGGIPHPEEDTLKPGEGGTPTEEIEEEYEDVEPILYTIYISQSISWLKDMYEAKLIVYNNSASQNIVAKDLSTTLKLPAGLSLAGTTNQKQQLTQSIPDLKGGESGSVSWYVRGDERGKYRLNALLGGKLMPFDANLYCEFESNDFDVSAGSGLVLIISPESCAEKDEKYYVYFTLKNESEKEFYDVKTSFGTSSSKK